MKLLIWMVSALLLAGCASLNQHWSATGHGGVPLARALPTCEFRAEQAVAARADSVDKTLARRAVIDRCMRARGFVWVRA